jgi:hypothetical protein
VEKDNKKSIESKKENQYLKNKQESERKTILDEVDEDAEKEKVWRADWVRRAARLEEVSCCCFV